MVNITRVSGGRNDPDYNRLLSHLATDPHNPRLLADAAEAAYKAGDLATAADLIARLANLGELPAPIHDLKGLIALRQGRFAEAARAFEGVLARDPGASGVTQNLAWARYNARDFAGALALLADAFVERLPAAAALRIEAMHQLGQLDAAFALAQTYAERYPDDEALLGVMSVLALDAGEPAAAARWAARAGDSPQGLATRGTLKIKSGDRRRIDHKSPLLPRHHHRRCDSLAGAPREA